MTTTTFIVVPPQAGVRQTREEAYLITRLAETATATQGLLEQCGWTRSLFIFFSHVFSFP